MFLRFTDNLIMQLTRGCNFNCSYCFQGNKEGKTKKVSIEEFKNFIDTALYERCILGDRDNFIDFHFHGGEVTLLGTDNLIEMMEYLKIRSKIFRGIHISIQSNGYLVDDKLARYLSENDISLGYSFDGFESERCSKTKTLEILERLKSYKENYGLKIGALAVISSKNVKTWLSDYLEVKDIMNGTGINIICTRPEDDNLIPSPKDVWEYIYLPILNSYLGPNPIIERSCSLVIEGIFRDLIFITESHPTQTIKTGCFDQICAHLTNMIAIDPEMNLTGCDKYLESGDFISKKETFNLNEKDFLGMKQIKKALDFYKELDKVRIKRGCDKCFARSYCPGECQSYNLSKYGELKAPSDDWCFLYKNIVQFIFENWTSIVIGKVFNSNKNLIKLRPIAKFELDNQNKMILIDQDTNTYMGVNKYDLQ